MRAMWEGLGLGLGESARTAALVVAWCAASAASNVAGKLVLAEFPFPLTVAVVQLAGVAALGGAALWAGGVPQSPPLPRAAHTRLLLPLALAKALSSVCSQISLWRVPVSYAHTVKATTPLWTCLLARVALGERPARGVVPALALLAGGVALASATELRFDGGGLAAALAAAALLAAQHLGAGRALRHHRQHPLRLLHALTLRALALAAAAALALDGAPPPLPRSRRAAALLAADGALAWLQAALALALLARVTPLTYAVCGAAKRCAVVAASLAVLRNPAPPANVAGMALAAAGALAYQRAKLARPPRAAAAPVLPL